MIYGKELELNLLGTLFLGLLSLVQTDTRKSTHNQLQHLDYEKVEYSKKISIMNDSPFFSEYLNC